MPMWRKQCNRHALWWGCPMLQPAIGPSGSRGGSHNPYSLTPAPDHPGLHRFGFPWAGTFRDCPLDGAIHSRRKRREVTCPPSYRAVHRHIILSRSVVFFFFRRSVPAGLSMAYGSGGMRFAFFRIFMLSHAFSTTIFLLFGAFLYKNFPHF